MAEWHVWSYDIWGNDEDGYDVNDRSEIGAVELPENPTDAQINEAIGEYFDTSIVCIDEGASDDMHIEIVLKEDEEYPVGMIDRGE